MNLVLTLLLMSSAASADVLKVTSKKDATPGSLRAMIAAAKPGDIVELNFDTTWQVVIKEPIVIDKDITIRGVSNEYGQQAQIRGSQKNRTQLFQFKGDSLKVNFDNLDIGSGVADRGGALYINGANDVVIKNCTLQGNVAENGGAIAALSESNDTSLTIENSKFLSNRAQNQGGAIFTAHYNLKISGSTFIANEAATGGALRTYIGGNTDIVNSVFTRNHSIMSGGAIMAGSSLKMAFNTVTNNSSSNGIGGLAGGVVKGFTGNIVAANSGNTYPDMLITFVEPSQGYNVIGFLRYSEKNGLPSTYNSKDVVGSIENPLQVLFKITDESGESKYIPRENNPAVGLSATCADYNGNPVKVDQLGHARPKMNCTAGAIQP